MEVLAETFSTNEACEMAGVTFRQLDYWLRQGYVHVECEASGSGSRRKFTRQEVIALRQVAAQLRLAESIQEALQDGTLWFDAMREQ